MIKTTVIALTIGTMGIFNVVEEFHRELPVSVEISHESLALTEVRQTLKILGRPEKFANDIYMAASAKGINPTLMTCLIETESEFKITARSSKNYQGLTQTPKAVGRTGYEFGDISYGVCVLAEKLTIAKGDQYLAMALYKGGNNASAKKEAAKVFTLFNKIKAKLKEPRNG